MGAWDQTDYQITKESGWQNGWVRPIWAQVRWRGQPRKGAAWLGSQSSKVVRKISGKNSVTVESQAQTGKEVIYDKGHGVLMDLWDWLHKGWSIGKVYKSMKDKGSQVLSVRERSYIEKKKKTRMNSGYWFGIRGIEYYCELRIFNIRVSRW